MSVNGSPRQYSHDADEVKAVADAGLTRQEVIEAIGRVTTVLARFQTSCIDQKELT